MIKSIRLRDTVAVGLLVLFAAAAVWAETTDVLSGSELLKAVREKDDNAAKPSYAQRAAKPAKSTAGVVSGQPAGDKLLQMIPAESLFVVRVNNLDYTLNTMDQFLAGLSPMGVSMLVRMQFANVLGSPELNGVNMAGNFAIFAVMAPDKSTEIGSFSDMFVAGLVPVTDYRQFISGNQNLGEPDEKGVSKITSGAMPAMLVAQVGNFALIGETDNYDKLVAMAKSISQAKTASLASVLDADEAKLAMKEPLWAYGNVQHASSVFGSMVSGQIEQMKIKFSECEDPNLQGPMANPAAVMDMYAGLFKTLMKETKSVTLTINPKPTVLNLAVSISSVPGTDMANMLVADPEAPQENKLLGYLKDDGAMMYFACKMNKALWSQINDKCLDLFAAIGGESMTSEDIAKWKTLATDAISSLGGSMVFSFSVDTKNKPPFALKYVIAVDDEKTFNRVIEESAELMNTGAFADFYKQMGMETSFTIKRGADSYKGVSIDSAKFMMKSTDVNSPQGQMINTMYGDGFTYKWAVVDGLCVYVVGGDVDSAIRELIDEVKSDSPKQMTSEMKSALALLSDPESADFIATLNILRAMKMGMSFASSMNAPVPMPQMDIPTKSNVVFAGRIAGGRATLEVAMPKEHLTEVMTAVMMMTMQQQMIQQQMIQQQMQKQPMMMQQNLWTCSMHPQVRMPQKGKCQMCGMELVPVSLPAE